MITQEKRQEIAIVVTALTANMREITEEGASSERQVELMREAISLMLAGHMFAAERQLHLGPRTEALRVTDRAHALYERCREHAAKAMDR